MSNSIPVLPLLFDQLSRKRHRLDGSLHWHWQELLIAHHWKQQQTQILFEYRGFYLAALLTQLVDFQYLYLRQLYFSVSICRICLPSKKYFSHLLKCISRLFTEDLLPASPADISTAGRVLSASSAWRWHDVDSASSTNISYFVLYLALPDILTSAVQVM